MDPNSDEYLNHRVALVREKYPLPHNRNQQAFVFRELHGLASSLESERRIKVTRSLCDYIVENCAILLSDNPYQLRDTVKRKMEDFISEVDEDSELAASCKRVLVFIDEIENENVKEPGYD